jgi:hypothetical protein
MKSPPPGDRRAQKSGQAMVSKLHAVRKNVRAGDFRRPFGSFRR